jgi:RNA polymerase sigma-70 factor (ECF subfamily)
MGSLLSHTVDWIRHPVDEVDRVNVTMTERNSLTEQFQASQPHLRAVAYRILGSKTEAEDAVQEAWLRLARSDTGDVENLRGWLTTVVARVCLDMLRTRKSRREQPMAEDAAERFASEENDAEGELQFTDSIGIALLIVLETLSPAERVAFVLHDMFNLSFDDIAPIVNRSPVAARQLASRARRRVQGSSQREADRSRQRDIVNAFMTASRDGDFAALLAVLDPNVVLRADAVAVQMSIARRAQGAPSIGPQTHGAEAVAKVFHGRAQGAQLAQVDGAAGLVFAPGGQPMVVFDFVVENGRIVEISLVANRESIQGMRLSIEN